MAVGKRLADDERNPQPSDGRERTRAQVGMRSALDSEAMPLDLMLIIMRGCPEADAITDLQFAAALAAAPFLHAKLTTICEASCWLNRERRTFAMLDRSGNKYTKRFRYRRNVPNVVTPEPQPTEAPADGSAPACDPNGLRNGSVTCSLFVG
jgi:hypothetical protein